MDIIKKAMIINVKIVYQYYSISSSEGKYVSTRHNAGALSLQSFFDGIYNFKSSQRIYIWVRCFLAFKRWCVIQ